MLLFSFLTRLKLKGIEGKQMQEEDETEWRVTPQKIQRFFQKEIIPITQEERGMDEQTPQTNLQKREGDEVRRNSDVMEILKRTRFSQSCRPDSGQPPPPLTILEHE